MSRSFEIAVAKSMAPAKRVALPSCRNQREEHFEGSDV
jgi:hypothetical protein